MPESLYAIAVEILMEARFQGLQPNVGTRHRADHGRDTGAAAVEPPHQVFVETPAAFHATS